MFGAWAFRDDSGALTLFVEERGELDFHDLAWRWLLYITLHLVITIAEHIAFSSDLGLYRESICGS